MSEKTLGPKRPQVLQLGKLLSAKLMPDTPLLGDLIFAKTIGMVAGPRRRSPGAFTQRRCTGNRSARLAGWDTCRRRFLGP